MNEHPLTKNDRSDRMLASGIMVEFLGAIAFNIEVNSRQFPFIGCTYTILGLALSIYGATPVTRRVESREEALAKKEYCAYCGTIIRPPSSRFCSNCGASAQSTTRDMAMLIRQELEIPARECWVMKDRPMATCLVCDLEVKPSDILIWCPHCGNVFHRLHLLEWIEVGGCCPACQEHLDKNGLNVRL